MSQSIRDIRVFVAAYAPGIDFRSLFADAGGLLASPGDMPDWMSRNEQAAAHWVFHHQKWAGRGTETLPGCVGIYVPLIASTVALGVLGLNQRAAGGLEPDQRLVLAVLPFERRDGVTTPAKLRRWIAEAPSDRSAARCAAVAGAHVGLHEDGFGAGGVFAQLGDPFGRLPIGHARVGEAGEREERRIGFGGDIRSEEHTSELQSH